MSSFLNGTSPETDSCCLAAPNQSSFHHYRDLVGNFQPHYSCRYLLVILQWCFDITTHSWERFDTKLRPSARSGHRMALWKHWIFLFGVRRFLFVSVSSTDFMFQLGQGFSDTGIRTSYLSDLWAWDTNEYRWHQIEISDVERKPG